MKKGIIYSGPRCAHCDWAKILLNKKNIDFVEYNISAVSYKHLRAHETGRTLV